MQCIIMENTLIKLTLHDEIKKRGDFKNNASISLINVYRLSKADLLLKLILRYVINVVLASCQVSSLMNVPFKYYMEKCHQNCHKGNTFL